MHQHHGSLHRFRQLREQLSGLLVREVALRRQDPSLEIVGIRATHEHVDVVVRFDEQHVAMTNVIDQSWRDFSEIGGDRRGARAVVDHERDLRGVVRKWQRGHGDSADREGLASVELVRGDRRRKGEMSRGRLAHVEGRARRPRELLGVTDVIAVRVGDHDPVDLAGAPDLTKFRRKLSGADSRVDDDPGVA